MARDSTVKKEVDLETVTDPEEVLEQDQPKTEVNPTTLPDFVSCYLDEACVYKGEIYPPGQANLPKEAFAKGLAEGWVRA